MPLPEGTRYRVKTTSKGKVRLAFLDGKVIEAKKLKKRKDQIDAIKRKLK